ncbi:MAG: phosphatase PAP2 family protein, partial [Acidimicrobiales bacterium]
MTQLALVVGAALLYFAVRGVTQGNETGAIARGLDLLRLERSLGIDIEAGLQNSILDNRALVTAFNWIYIWGHWPVITATLLWLHRTNRSEYTLLRNAMFASGAIGLVIFTLYPVAPPRLLDIGMVDTVTNFSNSYRVLQPPSLVNKYAALPSLHVGWNLLVGIAVFRSTRLKALHAMAILGPVAVVAAVILTANHYTIDAAAGVAVALTGLWIAHNVQHRSSGAKAGRASRARSTRTSGTSGIDQT